MSTSFENVFFQKARGIDDDLPRICNWHNFRLTFAGARTIHLPHKIKTFFQKAISRSSLLFLTSFSSLSSWVALGVGKGARKKEKSDWKEPLVSVSVFIYRGNHSISSLYSGKPPWASISQFTIYKSNLLMLYFINKLSHHRHQGPAFWGCVFIF